ncbi:MAG: sensor histidine kinase, partial [Pseudomonadota bacterium]
MTSGFFTGDILRGLAVRVLFFLSVALLPIGLIAITQTREIAEQNRTNGELSLIAVTEQASTAERRILQEAFGAAEALASIVLLHHDDQDACSSFFGAYREATDTYAMVGFIPLSGLMTCSSSAGQFDFSQLQTFQQALANPTRRADAFAAGLFNDQAVTMVMAPVFDDQGFIGFVAISIPFSALEEINEPSLTQTPLALMTFNAEGDILTSEQAGMLHSDEAPLSTPLGQLTLETPSVFKDANQNAVPRVYAVQPIVTNAVYAISVWPADTPFLDPGIIARLGALLPVSMWAASLIVAFWALNRLAIRHIRKLGRQMRRFAANRNLPRVTLGSGVPSELIEMEAAFISMGESILRDEAQLEDSLREKNILLKEVHHRVKNNLQLISSIMNMQIRRSKSEDAKRVLKRLQERILSLATVHKNLYQNDELGRVDAAPLLDETVSQLLNVGLLPGSNVEITQNYDTVMLNVDDAAPLTLLTSEALTNALKHIAQNVSTKNRIDIQLKRIETDLAVLTISNTVGAVASDGGTGLGAQLINAFARQLHGQVDIDISETNYTLRVQFPVTDRVKPTYDY